MTIFLFALGIQTGSYHISNNYLEISIISLVFFFFHRYQAMKTRILHFNCKNPGQFYANSESRNFVLVLKSSLSFPNLDHIDDTCS